MFASSAELHHPRAALPLRCMLSSAVSAGRPVYPRAHGTRSETRRLQEAQQRCPEPLPQPPGQRGRGQGAPAGGQQRITSAKEGPTPSLHPRNPCTNEQTHTFPPHGHARTSGTHQTWVPLRGASVCACVHSTKVGTRSLAALLFFKSGGLWGLSNDPAQRVCWVYFLGGAAVERCVCVCVWLGWAGLFGFYKTSGAYSSSPPTGATQRGSDLVKSVRY